MSLQIGAARSVASLVVAMLAAGCALVVGALMETAKAAPQEVSTCQPIRSSTARACVSARFEPQADGTGWRVLRIAVWAREVSQFDSCPAVDVIAIRLLSTTGSRLWERTTPELCRSSDVSYAWSPDIDMDEGLVTLEYDARLDGDTHESGTVSLAVPAGPAANPALARTPLPSPSPIASPTPISSPSPSPSPADSSTPAPIPLPWPTADPGEPVGWELHRDLDLSSARGWTLQEESNSNHEGRDRAANCDFGRGPTADWLEVVTDRDTADGQVYTCDALAAHVAVPNTHRTRVVLSWDTFTSGHWPAYWARPLSGGNMEGEIDYWEKFGGSLGQADEDRSDLHSTPYGAGQCHVPHKHVSAPLPSNVDYVIESELRAGVFTIWVNGVQQTRMTKASYETHCPGKWDAMFGDEAKSWYLRFTTQAGGPFAGTLPSGFMGPWRLTVKDVKIYTPEAP